MINATITAATIITIIIDDIHIAVRAVIQITAIIIVRSSGGTGVHLHTISIGAAAAATNITIIVIAAIIVDCDDGVIRRTSVTIVTIITVVHVQNW